MTYQYLATSVAGFIQQAAVAYVHHGYWFYVIGTIPKGKKGSRIDQKLLEKYQVSLSKDQRYRRKQKGLANVQYLRYQETFLLLATAGKHRFLVEETTKDVRRSPIRLLGYAIGYQAGRVRVSLDAKHFRRLKADFLKLALRKSPQHLAWKFRTLPFEPYRPVYRQLRSIWKAVNRQRKTAGLPLVPSSALRTRRRSYCPFESEKEGKSRQPVERANGNGRATREHRD